jgi:HTH-type transcriptional regulator/antitoxin HigA
MMNIQPIRTDADYRLALRELSACFDNEPELGSEEGDRFAELIATVEAYEAKHFPVGTES